MRDYQYRYIPLSFAHKYVSDYAYCSSCYDEIDEGYSQGCDSDYYYEGIYYTLIHCCQFPSDELTEDIWLKIINDFKEKEK